MPPTPLDTLKLSEFLPYRLSVLGERISRAFGALYGEIFGISIPEWRVMAVIGEFQHCTAGDVIIRTEMDRVKVSRAVIRLVDIGLISQKSAPSDKRSYVLSLTRKGRGVYAKIVPIARCIETEFTSVLGPGELLALDTLLTKLHTSAGRLREINHKDE
jgi:DNA-binding MarR family transcriptional regulator